MRPAAARTEEIMPDDGELMTKQRAEAEKSQPWPTQGRAAVVIAGAGARGAYEAGALAVLMPALFGADGLRDVQLLGTSAGAVNAALWAQHLASGASLAQVGEKVCEFWMDLTVDKVFRPISIGAIRSVLLKLTSGKVASLLDTEPLLQHATKTFDPAKIAANIASGRLGGVGVVATTCPEDGTGGVSRVFLQLGNQFPVPKRDPTSSIEYVAEPLTAKHILASAAIPLFFPSVQIVEGDGYYCDGGVRLNTPIEPALKLGAKRLVVVSSHAMKYPRLALPNECPDLIDLAAQAIHVVLADGLIEDLRTLKRINQIVRRAAESHLTVIDDFVDPPRPYEDIPFITASPCPGTLSKTAREVFRNPNSLGPNQSFRLAEYKLLDLIIAGLGRGAGNDEILSYLLFGPTYAEAQIRLGKNAAHEALNQM
jgi:NTE family protein